LVESSDDFVLGCGLRVPDRIRPDSRPGSERSLLVLLRLERLVPEMNMIDNRPDGDSKQEDRSCGHCGKNPRFVGEMLDPVKGRAIRMYRCHCGEQTWTAVSS
jgi:hypothetical protein